MIKIEKVETYGWESALRGMRNPMNSWDKGDSEFVPDLKIGDNDLKLMQSLCSGGSDDRKFMRQIFVTMDITAPLYWWKEMDQYKVGTVTNSCSTMHKIHAKEFADEDFSTEKIKDVNSKYAFKNIIIELNRCRINFINCKEQEVKKNWWYQMIQLLPSSYNQKRTWSANYEVLHNIYHARKNHKLDEWHTFCDIIEKLPYASELIGEKKDGK